MTASVPTLLKLISLFIFGFMLSILYKATRHFITAMKGSSGKDRLLSAVFYLVVLYGGFYFFNFLGEKMVAAIQWAAGLSFIYISLIAFGIVLLVNGVNWLSNKEQLMMGRLGNSRKGRIMRWLPTAMLIVFIVLFLSLA